jgi:hypothetical protein
LAARLREESYEEEICLLEKYWRVFEEVGKDAPNEDVSVYSRAPPSFLGRHRRGLGH